MPQTKSFIPDSEYCFLITSRSFLKSHHDNQTLYIFLCMNERMHAWTHVEWTTSHTRDRDSACMHNYSLRPAQAHFCLRVICHIYLDPCFINQNQMFWDHFSSLHTSAVHTESVRDALLFLCCRICLTPTHQPFFPLEKRVQPRIPRWQPTCSRD